MKWDTWDMKCKTWQNKNKKWHLSVLLTGDATFMWCEIYIYIFFEHLAHCLLAKQLPRLADNAHPILMLSEQLCFLKISSSCEAIFNCWKFCSTPVLWTIINHRYAFQVKDKRVTICIGPCQCRYLFWTCFALHGHRNVGYSSLLSSY